MSVIGALVMKIDHIVFLVFRSPLEPCHTSMIQTHPVVTKAKNRMCGISITNGPMTLIFCSFVVLDSTLKLQNMIFKLPVVFEIGGDRSQIFTISLSETDVSIISFSDFRLPTLLWTNKTRAPMIGLPYKFF